MSPPGVRTRLRGLLRSADGGESARRRGPETEARSGADQWQRVVLNRAVDRHIDSLGPESLAAAEISGDAYARKPWRSYRSLNHPPFDVCSPVAEPGAYDVVICEQVLEHVVDPWLAAENLRALTKPGGHVIVSTPFLVRVHELPSYALKDYWRFTPRGLQTLLERAGLAVDEIGHWGNRSCITANFDIWPAYRDGAHALDDEPDLPVQVWAFARNSSSSP